METRFRLWVIGLVIGLSLGITGIVYAVSHAPTNNTPTYTGSNAPQILSPGWRFWGATDTAWGEVVCVEVHPVGDPVNYVRVEGTYNGNSYSHDGHTDYEYQIDVFTGGIPEVFKNKTIEYQFFVASYGSNCSGGGDFTGFNWTFTSGPNAVTLTRVQARTTSWPFVAGALMLLGAALVLRKK